MVRFFVYVYEFIFSVKLFYKVNKLFLLISLKGLGIDNSGKVSEEGETTFLTTFLANRKKLVVIDVGANVGNYSSKIKSINDSTVIYAFEPHPLIFKNLEDIAGRLKFEAINKGCGETKGILTLFDYDTNDGSEHASLMKEVIVDIHHSAATEHKVEIITIDDFIAEKNITKVDLLKIDTEGFELSVLKGSIKAIEEGKIQTIVFEFNSMNMISRVFFRDFVKLLHQYNFYRIVRNGLIKIETDKPLMSEIFGFQNIVAIRK